MMEVQEEKSDLSNDVHSSTIINNNNNNNEEGKLVLTIKVNQNDGDEVENESITSVNQNFHHQKKNNHHNNNNNNNSTIVHVTSDDSLSALQPSNISICNVNGSCSNGGHADHDSDPSLNETKVCIAEDDDNDGAGEEEFDFSDSDFEDDDPANIPNQSIVEKVHPTEDPDTEDPKVPTPPLPELVAEKDSLPIPDDGLSVLQSPGPASGTVMVLSPVIDIEDDEPKRPEHDDDDLITQFFDKANDIVGFDEFEIFTRLLVKGERLLFCLRFLSLQNCLGE